MQKHLKVIEIIFASMTLLVLAFVTYAYTPVEYYRETDPSGKYTCIVSYRRYLSWIPMSPGSGSDKPGFAEIIDDKGSLGRIPIPMLQLAGIKWNKDTAEIELIGEWNLVKRTCYYWSKDGNEKIFVKK